MEAAVKEASSLLSYSSLKEEQLCSIKAFIDGRDVFVILPTGFGKSVCFTCLPLAIASNLLLQTDDHLSSGAFCSCCDKIYTCMRP